MSSVAAGGGHESSRASGFLLTVNFVLLTTVLARALGFAALILVSQTLGAEGRGVTALYQSAVNITFLFLGLGLGAASVYFISRGEITARDGLEAGLTMTLAATAVSAAGLLVLYAAFHGETTYDGVPYVLALVAIPCFLQFNILENVLRGAGRFGAMNALNLLLPLSAFMGFLIAEVFFGLTIRRAVIAWSLCFVPGIFIGYLLVGASAWPRRLMGIGRLRPLVIFGAKSQAGNLVQLLNYRLDSYLILLMTNATGVGLYATGVSLSEGLWFVANSAAVVLVTRLAAGDDAYKLRMTPLVCRGTLVVTALGALAAAALAPFVIPLVFGAEFDKAVVPFLCLLPGTVALAGAKILSTYVFAVGRPGVNTLIAIATLVATVVADLALIPSFGVTGAAIGASIAYGVSLALTAEAYRRLSGASVFDALVPRPSDAVLALDAVRGLRGRFVSR